MFYFELEVSLRYLTPRIWRRFLLHEDSTFFDLHQAVQDCFEWEGYHLWEFSQHRAGAIAGRVHEYSEPGMVDARTLALAQYFGWPGAPKNKKCDYLYDFGDSWEHQIVLKRFVEHKDGEPVWRRQLLGGAHAAPFEDCGGAPGFERLCALHKHGVDPWGEDAEELKTYYDLERLDGFPLESIKAEFDEPYKKRPGRRKQVFNAAAFEAEPTHVQSSDAADVISRVEAILGRALEPRHAQVFEVLERCFTLGADEEHLIIAREAWALLLEHVELKPRKPEIYAASLFYALEQLFSSQPYGQGEIAAVFEVSVSSISTTYKELQDHLAPYVPDLGALCNELFADELDLVFFEQPSPLPPALHHAPLGKGGGSVGGLLQSPEQLDVVLKLLEFGQRPLPQRSASASKLLEMEAELVSLKEQLTAAFGPSSTGAPKPAPLANAPKKASKPKTKKKSKQAPKRSRRRTKPK